MDSKDKDATGLQSVIIQQEEAYEKRKVSTTALL